MKEYVTALMRIRPKLEKIERALERKLEQVALDRRADTAKTVARVMRVIDWKRQVADLAEAHRRLTSCFGERERTVAEGKASGLTEAEIASRIGLSPRSVRTVAARVDRIYETVLAAMKKTGLDPSSCSEILVRFGGLPKQAA